MTPLSIQNGALIVRNGALGTEQGCCCGNCQICCYAYAHSTTDPDVAEPTPTTTESGCEECYRACVEETYPASEYPDANGNCQAGYTLVDGVCYGQCPEGFTLDVSTGRCRKVTQVPLNSEECEGQLSGLYGPCGEWQASNREPCECVDYGCDCQWPGPNSECSENFYEEGSNTSPFADIGDRRRSVEQRTLVAYMNWEFANHPSVFLHEISMRPNEGLTPWTFLWKATPAVLQGRQFFSVWERSIADDSEVTGWNPPAGYGGVPGDNELYAVSDHWTITRERLRFYVVECIGEAQQIRDATGEYVDLFYNGAPYDGSVIENASGYQYDLLSGCGSFSSPRCPPTTGQPAGADFCTTSLTLDCNPLP